MYSHSHILSDPVGNNAFSYDVRTNKALFVPSVVEGDFSDVRVGTRTAFEDVDERGVLRSCVGLEHFIRTVWHGVPVVVFDNHNHTLYFWYEALAHGKISTGSTLAHIDEHSDLWENSSVIPTFSSVIPAQAGISWNRVDLDGIFHFTNYSCHVGNYIQPALREGIVSKVLRIEWEGDIERFASYATRPNESLILNLDLDFFSPELDYIPFESKKACILHFAGQARLITIATSPFFIDQDRAIRMMMRVFTDDSIGERSSGFCSDRE